MLSKLPVAERLWLVASAVFSCGSSSRCSIDTQDNLETEIQKKAAKGYPLTNTIFADTRRGYLYQNDEVALVADLTQPQQLVDLLNLFFSYTAPAHEDFFVGWISCPIFLGARSVPYLLDGLVGCG